MRGASMNSQNKSKTQGIGFLLLAFIAPVVIAKLVLSLNLYHGGATNHGELINPETSYASLGVENPPKNGNCYIYYPPNATMLAANACIFLLRCQSHTALGPDQARVEPLILTHPDSDLNALSAFHFNTRPANAGLSHWPDETNSRS